MTGHLVEIQKRQDELAVGGRKPLFTDEKPAHRGPDEFRQQDGGNERQAQAAFAVINAPRPKAIAGPPQIIGIKAFVTNPIQPRRKTFGDLACGVNGYSVARRRFFHAQWEIAASI